MQTIQEPAGLYEVERRARYAVRPLTPLLLADQAALGADAAARRCLPARLRANESSCCTPNLRTSRPPHRRESIEYFSLKI